LILGVARNRPHPGVDILVSSTVNDIVVGSDARFEDRGQHSLKRMLGEW
jgi:hypothetical protein